MANGDLHVTRNQDTGEILFERETVIVGQVVRVPVAGHVHYQGSFASFRGYLGGSPLKEMDLEELAKAHEEMRKSDIEYMANKYRDERGLPGTLTTAELLQLMLAEGKAIFDPEESEQSD